MKLPEITEKEQIVLLAALGAASGAMAKNGNREMAGAVLRLINSLMRDVPDWEPYEEHQIEEYSK